MSILTAFATMLGAPSVLLALVLSAVSLLELERRWTRARRFAGMPVGTFALILDGLVILTALLAIIGGVLMLTQVAVSALKYTFAQISDLAVQIDGTAAGLTLGATIALIALIFLIRRITIRVPPSTHQSESGGDAHVQLPTLDASPRPAAASTPALPDRMTPDTLEEEPPLVMLRTRRPAPRSVPTPDHTRLQGTASPHPSPAARRFHWGVVAMIALLAVGAAGIVYRNTVLAMLSGLARQTTQSVVSVPSGADMPADPTAPVVSATVAPTPASQMLQVAVERLNLRTGPGTGYPVVTTLKRGDVIESLGETVSSGEDVWIRVRVGAQEGWVFRAFLQEPTSPSP
jgi:hypothetical protein